MGELIMSGQLADLVRKNKITQEDVLMLRRDYYADGIIDPKEATAVLALDRSCREKCDAWDEFYVEMLGDYLVFQTKPRGHISPQNAEGIIRAISVDGIIDTRTELELLLHILKKAESVPPSFAAFALKQVAHAVLKGEGVLARGRQLRPGVVTQDDVEMLRTVLYSAGSPDSIGISREEANVLFDINDQTAMAANHPSWQGLFTRAVAASALMVSGYRPITWDDAVSRQAWMEESEINIGSFFSRMFAGGLRSYRNALGATDTVEELAAERNSQRAADVLIAEVVDQEEAEWLAERINRDGRLHENERELLRFMSEQAPIIAEPLRVLLRQAA